jgi:hypothetical protein
MALPKTNRGNSRFLSDVESLVRLWELGTRQIAPPRNAVQHSGTKGALTAGCGKRGSRRGVAVRHLCESPDRLTEGKGGRITLPNS